MTAATPMDPLHGAVYVRLTADAELMAAVTGVWDHIPEDAQFPFVQLGEVVETPDNRHGQFGRQSVLTLHTWSKYRGYGEARAVMAHQVRLLDHQPLIIPGHVWIATRFEFAQTMTDPEPPGDLRHGITRFRVVTEQP